MHIIHNIKNNYIKNLLNLNRMFSDRIDDGYYEINIIYTIQTL